MGKKIFAEISKKYFGVGPVLVQGGPDLVQGGPLLVQGGPLLVQPRVSSTVIIFQKMFAKPLKKNIPKKLFVDINVNLQMRVK